MSTTTKWILAIVIIIFIVMPAVFFIVSMRNAKKIMAQNNALKAVQSPIDIKSI